MFTCLRSDVYWALKTFKSPHFICDVLKKNPKMKDLASSQSIAFKKTGVAWKCHPRRPCPAVQVISGLIDAWGSPAWSDQNRFPVPVFHLWRLYKRSLWSPPHTNVPSLAYITPGITDAGGMTHETGESRPGSSSPASEQQVAFHKGFSICPAGSLISDPL